MHSLWIAYSALAVFGLGVTVVDLFGVFDHASSQSDHDDASGSDPGHDDGVGTDEGSAVEVADHDSSEPGHDVGHHDASHEGHGSYVASADAGTKAVARTIGLLRLGVYFSLGAGPTGLFALITGVNASSSLAWSAGAGAFIAILARSLRSFIRKDLDSSIKPEEFLMDAARIIVPITPGSMGKAAVQRYGKETVIYVRCKDPDLAFSKGAEVRIVDWDDDCYWVQAFS